MSYVNDMANLAIMEAALPVNNALRNVLAEVRAISAHVIDHIHQDTSGTAIARYDPTAGNTRAGWVIKYQDGNLGNLVHELTHAVTHQQYETDGITYLSNKVVTARTFTDGFPVAGQNLSYCNNEELRQMQFRIETAEEWMTVNTNRLYRWARAYGMTGDQLAQCAERRTYGVVNIQREYDTLINHMLVWLHQWGYYPLPALPNPPDPSFPRYLEAAVAEAYNRRQNVTAITGHAMPVPEPPVTPITITVKVWEKTTSRFGHFRSGDLKKVDKALKAYHKAVGAANQFTAAVALKNAFELWSANHPNEKTKRDKHNIMNRLTAQIAAAQPF